MTLSCVRKTQLCWPPLSLTTSHTKRYLVPKPTRRRREQRLQRVFGYPQTIEQYLEHMSDEALEIAIAGLRQLMTPEELALADAEKA